MKRIEMFGDKFALVDDEDYERVNLWGWYVDCDGYAMPTSRKARGLGIRSMHRFIMNAPKGVQIDHINRDKLDNQKENLRFCSGTENQRNRGIQKTNTSGYKGITFRKSYNKFEAKIIVDNKYIYLGSFELAEDAAKAYDEAAKKYYKEFAYLNFG